MKKIILVILMLLWIAAFLVLIAALTDLFAANVFKKHQFIVVIGFMALSGFVLKLYKMWVKKT